MHAARCLVRVLRPRVVADLAGMRNAVEHPAQLAGHDVPRGHVAGRRLVTRALRRQRHDHQVLEYAPGVARDERAHFRDVPAVGRERAAQVDAAVVAEARDGGARARVDFREEARVEIEEPAVGSVHALPIVHAARTDGALVRMRPELFARRGIERDDLVLAREHVHHTVHDDRVEDEASLAGREGPCHLELGDVRLVDLLQRRSTARSARRRRRFARCCTAARAPRRSRRVPTNAASATIPTTGLLLVLLHTSSEWARPAGDRKRLRGALMFYNRGRRCFRASRRPGPSMVGVTQKGGQPCSSACFDSRPPRRRFA